MTPPGGPKTRIIISHPTCHHGHTICIAGSHIRPPAGEDRLDRNPPPSSAQATSTLAARGTKPTIRSLAHTCTASASCLLSARGRAAAACPAAAPTIALCHNVASPRSAPSAEVEPHHHSQPAAPNRQDDRQPDQPSRECLWRGISTTRPVAQQAVRTRSRRHSLTSLLSLLSLRRSRSSRRSLKHFGDDCCVLFFVFFRYFPWFGNFHLIEGVRPAPSEI